MIALPGKSRTRLLLRRDSEQGLLQWVIALVTFVALTAIMIAVMLAHGSATWREQVQGRLTVQLLYESSAPDSVSIARTLNRITDRLRENPRIDRIETLDRAQLDQLLQPWISGELLRQTGIAIPGMIEITLHPGQEINPTTLRETLAEIAEDPARIVVSAHAGWLADLIRLSAGLQWIAWLIVALLTGACLLSVVLVTRSSITAQRETVELLHLIGARDRFIAGQFQRISFRMSLFGAFRGLILFVLVFLVFSRFAESVDGLLLARILAPSIWLLMLLPLPWLLALIASYSAGITVHRAIRRLP